jgi:hypothetical protein
MFDIVAYIFLDIENKQGYLLANEVLFIHLYVQKYTTISLLAIQLILICAISRYCIIPFQNGETIVLACLFLYFFL